MVTDYNSLNNMSLFDYTDINKWMERKNIKENKKKKTNLKITLNIYKF